MNGKEVGNFFRNKIIPYFLTGALIASFIKIESCDNSQDVQVHNQTGELTENGLEQDGLLDKLSEGIKHLLESRK
ncbi:MAG: hypothetical protein A3B47_03670 [Candidatus Levybacteria bacterium RIFCSPLOWO2_01_FULL_39_24]|nr:MAG: hypothetical protein A2800_03475 [Candidatus Levybacteria bacterium RIFCSPHIGHO2_01_FULL_40_16]OGH28153.1 MAG: hypothetical protein A3E12_04175 [Candidatus Levybacteria bacterium RIFCSPHIGHO2_12_FULL_39_9]OGH46338.1 MAG: hypothetical protein A3B47_03670 [Candidatus Levybacteria bacterium RIFCSPLOWO2_01_FULL_39_24]